MKTCLKCHARYQDYAHYCKHDGQRLIKIGPVSNFGAWFDSLGCFARGFLILFIFFSGCYTFTRVESCVDPQIPPKLFGGSLSYSVISEKNYGEGQDSWAEYTVEVRTATLPAETKLRKTAADIWRIEGSGFHGFTVEIYLEGMSFGGKPYAEANFEGTKVTSFSVSPEALKGTVWE